MNFDKKVNRLFTRLFETSVDPYDRESVELEQLVTRLLAVVRTAKEVRDRLDRLQMRGQIEGGIRTINDDDFDVWFIRDELEKALEELERE